MSHPHSERSFRESRTSGIAWERAVLRWLLLKERCTVPSPSSWPLAAPMGPRLFVPRPDGSIVKLVLPDIPVIRETQHEYCEVKSGKGFCWSSYEKEWQISFDVVQYQDYLAISQIHSMPVWLYVVVEQSEPTQSDRDKGCSLPYPARGLYRIAVEHIARLKASGRTHENHGEIYVQADAFTLIASYEEIQNYLPGRAA